MKIKKVALYANGTLGVLTAQLFIYRGNCFDLTIATPDQGEYERFLSSGIQTTVTDRYLDEDFDCVLSCNWPRIFDEKFCLLFNDKCFNLHASHDLMFRGRYPNIFLIRAQVEHDIKMHGVCIHKIQPQLDSGDVVLAVKYPIDLTVTSQELEINNIRATGELVSRFIDILSSDTPFNPQSPSAKWFSFRQRDLGSKELMQIEAVDAYDFVRSLDHDEYERAYIIQDGLKRFLTTIPKHSSEIAHIRADSKIIYFVS